MALSRKYHSIEINSDGFLVMFDNQTQEQCDNSNFYISDSNSTVKIILNNYTNGLNFTAFTLSTNCSLFINISNPNLKPRKFIKITGNLDGSFIDGSKDFHKYISLIYSNSSKNTGLNEYCVYMYKIGNCVNQSYVHIDNISKILINTSNDIKLTMLPEENDFYKSINVSIPKIDYTIKIVSYSRFNTYNFNCDQNTSLDLEGISFSIINNNINKLNLLNCDGINKELIVGTLTTDFESIQNINRITVKKKLNFISTNFQLRLPLLTLESNVSADIGDVSSFTDIGIKDDFLVMGFEERNMVFRLLEHSKITMKTYAEFHNIACYSDTDKVSKQITIISKNNLLLNMKGNCFLANVQAAELRYNISQDQTDLGEVVALKLILISEISKFMKVTLEKLKTDFISPNSPFFSIIVEEISNSVKMLSSLKFNINIGHSSISSIYIRKQNMLFGFSRIHPYIVTTDSVPITDLSPSKSKARTVFITEAPMLSGAPDIIPFETKSKSHGFISGKECFRLVLKKNTILIEWIKQISEIPISYSTVNGEADLKLHNKQLISIIERPPETVRDATFFLPSSISFNVSLMSIRDVKFIGNASNVNISGIFSPISNINFVSMNIFAFDLTFGGRSVTFTDSSIDGNIKSNGDLQKATADVEVLSKLKGAKYITATSIISKIKFDKGLVIISDKNEEIPCKEASIRIGNTFELEATEIIDFNRFVITESPKEIVICIKRNKCNQEMVGAIQFSSYKPSILIRTDFYTGNNFGDVKFEFSGVNEIIEMGDASFTESQPLSVVFSDSKIKVLHFNRLSIGENSIKITPDFQMIAEHLDISGKARQKINVHRSVRLSGSVSRVRVNNSKGIAIDLMYSRNNLPKIEVTQPPSSLRVIKDGEIKDSDYIRMFEKPRALVEGIEENDCRKLIEKVEFISDIAEFSSHSQEFALEFGCDVFYGSPRLFARLKLPPPSTPPPTKEQLSAEFVKMAIFTAVSGSVMSAVAVITCVFGYKYLFGESDEYDEDKVSLLPRPKGLEANCL